MAAAAEYNQIALALQTYVTKHAEQQKQIHETMKAERDALQAKKKEKKLIDESKVAAVAAIERLKTIKALQAATAQDKFTLKNYLNNMTKLEVTLEAAETAAASSAAEAATAVAERDAAVAGGAELGRLVDTLDSYIADLNTKRDSLRQPRFNFVGDADAKLKTIFVINDAKLMKITSENEQLKADIKAIDKKVWDELGKEEQATAEGKPAAGVESKTSAPSFTPIPPPTKLYGHLRPLKFRF